jgi:hypothetical protein
VPYTNTVGIGGNGQYLYALSGSGITSGSISNAAIADATITSNKLAFAIGSGGTTYSNLTESGYVTTVRSNFVVNAGSANTLVVTNGKVGIGTTAPEYLVHAKTAAASSFTPALFLENPSATDSNGAVGILFKARGGGTGTGARAKGGIAYELDGTGFGMGSLHFLQNSAATEAAAGLANAVMTIKNNGNVGIGTTSPATNLHVAGSVLATNFALGSASINSWDDVTNYFTMPGGATGGAYQWTNDVNADGNNLYEAATIYGSSNSAALTLTGSADAQDNAISIYRTNSGNGIAYFSQIGHEFTGPVSFIDGIGNISAGTVAATGNLTATGTSNFVAALHTDTFSMDELDVENLYGTNIFTLLTNATGLATDGDGKIIAGSGGGTTYSNLTETGYVSGFRSNVVVTGNALGTTITPILTLTNATAAANGAQQNSPALMLGGAGYNTTGSTSAPVSMGFVTVPVQGTTPTARLTLVSSVGDAAPATTGAYFSNGGSLDTLGYITAGQGIYSGGGAGAVFSWNTSAAVRLYNPKPEVLTVNAYMGSNLVMVLANGSLASTAATLNQSTDWPALRVESSTNNVTLGFRKGTNTSEWLNFKGIYTPPIKAGFSTNYTMTGTTENMLFCTGTNQVITLPNATNSPGIMLSIRVASTTGSVIVTNATGAQTIFGTLSVSVGATNVLNVASDGTHWW